MHNRDVSAGEAIFAEGDTADTAYLIERGAVEIAVGRGDDRKVLAQLGPGEVFGEMGLIDGTPRSAAAAAVSDCRLVVVTSDQIRQAIARSDPFFAELMRKLVGRLRQTQTALLQGNDIIGVRTSDIGPGYSELLRERDIAQAIIEGSVEPFLQPIVDLHDGRTLGFETLARCRSEQAGLMQPFDFLPLARRTGLIRRVDLGMAERALACCRRISGEADGPFVSINVSAWHFQTDQLPDSLTRMAELHGVVPSRVCVEITESVLIDDIALAERTMDDLHDAGFRVALDDFGTGFSSLTFLHRLPFDLIKVDGILVGGAQTSARQRAMLQGLVELCDRLDIELIAEGVEDAGTVRTLLDLGFTMGQGAHFALPAPAEQVIAAWGRE